LIAAYFVSSFFAYGPGEVEFVMTMKCSLRSGFSSFFSVPGGATFFQ
jgi:hypothetical protein